MKITKKTMKRMFAAACALAMTAVCAVPASAGTLTPQELYEKYLPIVTAEKADANAPYYVYYDGTGNSLSEDEVEQEVIEKVSKLEDGSFDTTELEELYGPWWWAKLQHFRMNPWFDVLNPKDGVPQRMFRDCEEENGFHYVIRDDGTANIVGCDVSLLMECDGVFAIPSEIGGVKVTRIENYAFCCTKGQQSRLRDKLEENGAVFTELVLPEYLEEIGEGAFYQFPTLQKELQLPNTLKSIGQNAFVGMPSEDSSTLRRSLFVQDKIVLPESIEYIGQGALGSLGISSVEIVLPESAVCGFLDNRKVRNDRHEEYRLSGILTPEDLMAPYDLNDLDGNISTPDELLQYLLSERPIYYTESNQENYYSWYSEDWFAEEKNEKPETAIGDLSEDGKVNVGDAVLLARFLGQDPDITNDITAQGLANSDVNGDGSTTADDLTALLKMIANAGR